MSMFCRHAVLERIIHLFESPHSSVTHLFCRLLLVWMLCSGPVGAMQFRRASVPLPDCTRNPLPRSPQKHWQVQCSWFICLYWHFNCCCSSIIEVNLPSAQSVSAGRLTDCPSTVQRWLLWAFKGKCSASSKDCCCGKLALNAAPQPLWCTMMVQCHSCFTKLAGHARAVLHTPGVSGSCLLLAAALAMIPAMP
jgi:hypothetical protein